jgi:hypothetical protein
MKTKLLISAFLFCTCILHAQQNKNNDKINSSTLCWYTPTADSLYYGMNILDFHVDNFGNCYTAGYMMRSYNGSNRAWCMVIQKIDQYGNLKWRKLWDAQSLYNGGDDYMSCFCNAITSDSLGNLYITGSYGFDKLKMDTITIINSNNYLRGFIAKLDSNGMTKWAINYSKPSSTTTFTCGGTDIKYLNDNQIFVFLWGKANLYMPTGVVYTLNSNYNILEIDKNGNFKKSTGISNYDAYGIQGIYNPDPGYYITNAITVVSPKMYISPKSGKLFVVGTFASHIDFVSPSIYVDSISKGINGFVAVMDTATGWQKAFVTYGTPTQLSSGQGLISNLYFPAFSVDTSDCIYIASGWDSIPGVYSASTMEISQGHFLSGKKGSIIAKYDKNGTLLWYNQNSVCIPRSLSTSSSNNILLYGEFNDSLRMISQNAPTLNIISNGGKDLFLASMDTKGKMNWLRNMGSSGTDYSWFMKSHRCSDNMYFVGSLDTTCMFLGNQLNNPGNKIFVSKYSEIGNCTDTACFNGNGSGIENYIIQNKFRIYPNPVIDNLTIESQQKSTIEISNIQGQLVKTITASEGKTNIDVSSFPCGVYVVQVKNENGVAVKKFIKE